MQTVGTVKQFTDYRAFLRAYVSKQKLRRPGWSLRVWSSRLGLGAASGISRVLKGQRDPSSELIDKLIHYFKFNESEAKYFKDLTRLKHVEDDPSLVVTLLEKMGKEHPLHQTHDLSVLEFEMFNHWCSFAVREMVSMTDFNEDPEWIASRFYFQVTVAQIQDALARLLKTGLLARDAQGKLVLGKGRLILAGNVRSQAVQNYQDQILDRAKEIQRLCPLEKRDHRATTFVISQSNLPKAKELINEFHRKMAELLEEGSGDSLYQFQSQLFPLTRNSTDA